MDVASFFEVNNARLLKINTKELTGESAANCVWSLELNLLYKTEQISKLQLLAYTPPTDD